MATVYIYPPKQGSRTTSPLPELLQTPSGLALLELQGTINWPNLTSDGGDSSQDSMEVGKLHFPDYIPDAEGSAWMKRVHLYIGQHQRLTGEVKKLPKAIAVVQKREGQDAGAEGHPDDEREDLEIVEIVKYKLIFSQRPEPVGTEHAT